ncbi:hypothetical protein ACH5RR_011142 [Cinchona calisaya]|uniref:Uncharacterized protein n=1 Tax=Cinchona calisaya TaxID=153742 RepID=A0ABD3A429_9GENT
MEEEKFILPEKPNINCGGFKAMPFIIGNEAFERLGTLGITSNLMVYLTTVFNMISVNAAMLLSAFIGTSNMASLLGAFIADSGFGRFKTLAFASVSSLLMLCLLISFTLLVIGAGGIRPCNLPFGADQFNTVTESGKRDIRSFFSWYYFTITFSMLIASTVIVHVQSNVSWGVGFAIATCLMSFAVALFFLGSKQCVKVIPDGSPFTSVAQVLVSATKKRQLDLPQHPSALFQHFPDDSLKVPLPYTNQFSNQPLETVHRATDRRSEISCKNNADMGISRDLPHSNVTRTDLFSTASSSIRQTFRKLQFCGTGSVLYGSLTANNYYLDSHIQSYSDSFTPKSDRQRWYWNHKSQPFKEWVLE